MVEGLLFAWEVGILTGDTSAKEKARQRPCVPDCRVTARASLPNRDGFWRPGMAVRCLVSVDQRRVPLAVRTDAIQQFRDFRVVFAKIGETYEVRMLELGQEGPEWTEVLGGIEAGTVYASENSYVIKADIEKSGASHDH